MKRRDFLKKVGTLLGVGIVAPVVVGKAISTPKPPLTWAGYEQMIQMLELGVISKDQAIDAYGMGHTTMRSVIAEQEFKNRRMKKLLEYQKEREIAFWDKNKI
ncbi:MAG: twin-arginine translocation signal domain-containing protein [Candidatus Brocadiales bacterium]|nr:twin-arginine translocation signal domain-containing protein [Candidatus Brocadiales bacterium]